MDDKIERFIEIVLSLGTSGWAMWAASVGIISGQTLTILIIAAVALYQSTSLAKIFKFNS